MLVFWGGRGRKEECFTYRAVMFEAHFAFASPFSLALQYLHLPEVDFWNHVSVHFSPAIFVFKKMGQLGRMVHKVMII